MFIASRKPPKKRRKRKVMCESYFLPSSIRLACRYIHKCIMGKKICAHEGAYERKEEKRKGQRERESKESSERDTTVNLTINIAY